ncbi:MAG TPA: metalloregulator ArsR/SmtB family transcription factor [Solirubrobacteraceae bacterium]|nr:metalloregulator ArsR/SmtB family transcription factor [Solirubrobacteraceae bacterium]
MSSAAEQGPGSGFELLRDPEVLRILAHPTRMRIYSAAVQEALSAKDIADRLEQPLARISYHVRTLADAGLLRAVRQTRRRGAVETHYRALATLDISDEVIAEAGPEAYAFLARAVVREMAEDTLDAIDRGASAAPDFTLARAHFRTTAKGRERLFEELVAIYDRLRDLEAELREEADAAGGETAETNLTLCFYEGEWLAGIRNSPTILLTTPEGEANRMPVQIPPPEVAPRGG